jgi:hypothetical protein
MAQRIGAFSAKVGREILSTVRELKSKVEAGRGTFSPYTPSPIYFYNTSTTETIPPFGCIQMVGTKVVDKTAYIEVARPFDYTNSVMGPFLINGPGECGPQDFGMAQWGPVFRAKKGVGTYSVGTRFGPQTSSYDIGKGCLFTFIGDDEIEEDIVKIIACETPIFAVAPTGIPGNGNADVTAKTPNASGWSGGTVEYKAYNPTSRAIEANSDVILFPVDAKWAALKVC